MRAMHPDLPQVSSEQVNAFAMAATAVITVLGAALTTLVFPTLTVIKGFIQGIPYDQVSKASRVALSVALQAMREGTVELAKTGGGKPPADVRALWLDRGIIAGFAFLTAQGSLEGALRAYGSRDNIQAAMTAYIAENTPLGRTLVGVLNA
jgi:hypothetical protein